jgi:mono/diheme cytochrome c family protein
MSLLSYKEARPWAKAIRAAVVDRKMPPWPVDPAFGKFSNERRLSQSEIDTLVAWAEQGAPEGDPKDAPAPRQFVEGWSIGKPDAVVELPKEFEIPATGDVPYQYIVVPTGFTKDTWVQAVEIRPGNRAALHHAIAFAREPETLKGTKIGEFLDPVLMAKLLAPRKNPPPDQFADGVGGDAVGFYVPGMPAAALQPGQARLLRAGSALMFQLHYTTNGKPGTDRTRIGFVFAKDPPKEWVRTVNVQNFAFSIPPREPNYPIEARARLTRDMKIVSFIPHMHLRGKDFEYRAIYPSGESETLLRVPRWDFAWQLVYYLKQPKILPKGTVIEVVGHYDNSPNNPNNPDPNALVVYGEQTWNEMMGGLIDVAEDATQKPQRYFEPVPEKAASTAALTPTFHKSVEPILQARCQGCHRPGEVAPMSFLTYGETRPWAKAIRAAVVQKKMPPWFADPHYGKFSNDQRLSQAELDTLVAWADSGAIEGDIKDAPKPREFVDGWSIGKPDVIIEVPKAFHVPAEGRVAYQYIAVASGFTEDKWVQAAEIRPGNRAVVHHVQAHAISPDSPSAKILGEFLDADAIDQRVIARTEKALAGGPMPNQFDSGLGGEYIQGYTPGAQPLDTKPGQAKLIKAGSVILFQLHYTSSGKAGSDQSRLGLVFAKQPPTERLHTVNVQNFAFDIPPMVDNYSISARARLTRDMKIVTLRPHMHFRGKDFEYRAIYPTGESEVLMRVPRWDFNWQMTYYLETPKVLPKGTIIEVLGHYDNSPNNPFNPDPKARVLYGEQTWNEMLGGLIDVALDPYTQSPQFFESVPAPAATNATAAVR